MSQSNMKGFSLLLVLVVVAVIAALGYGGYLTMGVNKTTNTVSGENDAVVAPAIRDQELYDAVKNENPAYSLPDNASVTTAEGNSIQLKLLFEMPHRGIYQYGNELYTYDMDANTFTHITDGDAATFERIPGDFSFDLYAKDKNNVYCRGEVLQGADAGTFQMIPGWNTEDARFRVYKDGRTDTWDYIYYQDKSNQYVFGECSPHTPS